MIKLSTRIEDSIGIHSFTAAERTRERASFAKLPANRRERAFSEARSVFELTKKYIEKAEDEAHSFLKATPEDIYEIIYGDAHEAYGLLGTGVILACRSGIDLDNYPKDVHGLGVTYEEIVRLSSKSMQLHIKSVIAAIDGENFEHCVRDLHQWGMRYANSTGIITDSFYSAIGRTKDDVDAQMLNQVFKRTPDKAVKASDELCSTLAITPSAKRKAFSMLNPEDKAKIYNAFNTGRSWASKHFGNSAERFNIGLSYSAYSAKGVNATYSSFNVG